MEENKLTKEKFIQFLKENVHDHGLNTKMLIIPNKGWEYELGAYITNIAFEPNGYNIAFISNAFSQDEPPLTIEEIINKLSEDDECKYIAFEIYALDKKTNTHEQIVSTSSDDLGIIQDYSNIIVIRVDAI